MKNIGNFVFGLLLGAAIAGAAVILFTPVSGNKLQKEISKKVNEILDEVKEANEHRQKELKSELETLRQGKVIQIESVE